MSEVKLNLNDGIASVRMKRLVTTGSYENAELEIILPCTIDHIDEAIEGLFQRMEKFQQEARKRLRYTRHMYIQDDEEEREE